MQPNCDNANKQTEAKGGPATTEKGWTANTLIIGCVISTVFHVNNMTCDMYQKNKIARAAGLT